VRYILCGAEMGSGDDLGRVRSLLNYQARIGTISWEIHARLVLRLDGLGRARRGVCGGAVIYKSIIRPHHRCNKFGRQPS
jgi:hypothetical protein